MLKIVKEFEKDQNYTIKDRFVFVLTNNFGVRGVFATYIKAEEKRDKLVKSLENPKKEYIITKSFLECIMEAKN